MIRVNAIGTPVPKGSKKLVTHGRGGRVLPRALLLDVKSHELDAWERSVAGAALVAIGARPRPVFADKDQGLVVRLELRLVRPKSVKRAHPTAKMDADKLARGPLDALTGLVWTDDGQVVELHVTKRYCAPGEAPGALIEIEAKDEQPAQAIFRLPAPQPGGG